MTPASAWYGVFLPPMLAEPCVTRISSEKCSGDRLFAAASSFLSPSSCFGSAAAGSVEAPLIASSAGSKDQRKRTDGDFTDRPPSKQRDAGLFHRPRNDRFHA